MKPPLIRMTYAGSPWVGLVKGSVPLMDNVDFGSPALQAMSVPAIVVLVVLAVLTLRSVALGDRSTNAGSAEREAGGFRRRRIRQRQAE
jgi:hypothetical protein